jgi:hypothetical protein
MMLADYARIADGKLFISGGGWSACGPGPTPCAVVAGPPGMTPGTEINVPVCFNLVLHLPPGRRYTWGLDVDGYADDSGRLTFETRPARA